MISVPFWCLSWKHRRSHGGAKRAIPPTFLACLVVLRLERRCPKRDTVARLKSKYLAPPKVLGWLRYGLERQFFKAVDYALLTV